MARSQNGYTANDITLTSVRTIPGTSRKIRLRNDAAGDLLLWILGQFDGLVEDIDAGQLDDWGYAERPIRGGTELSNHASGTAADVNAVRHPLGTDPTATFSKEQISTIRRLVAWTEGCVRWGGDYVGRKDPMHFEIVAPESRCTAVLRKLTAAGGGVGTIGDDDMTPDQSRKLDALHEQLTGSRQADQYPGWQSFKYPKDPKARATVTDYVRHIDENLINTTARVDSVEAKLDQVIALLKAKGSAA